MAVSLSVDVRKQFPSGAAIDAQFTVGAAAGGIVVLFGPSGAGKTTVVRSVAGLERPDGGRIECAGELWFDGSGRWVAPQRRRVGYAGQQPALFPHLTVRDNVAYGNRNGVAIDGLLARLGLGPLARRYPRELSGGEAQRVAVARAVATAPRILLLDEPFAGLDTPARVELRRDLRAIARDLRAAILVVTHDRTDAMALADEVVVLIDGRVRQIGPVVDVFSRPADLSVARSVGVESVLPGTTEASGAGLVDVRVGQATLRAVDAGTSPGREVFACIRGEDVTLQRAPVPGVSARNHLAGRIARIEPEGPLDRVTIDCGFPLVALVTHQAREEMKLAEGMPIVAAVKATAIHLVPRD